MKGKITRGKYHVATIFIDIHSNLSYMYLQRWSKSDYTVQAKSAFEKYSFFHGIQIKHYHEDNGILAYNAFVHSCDKDGQTLYFCGVNDHWENSVAEKIIRDIQSQSIIMMLHAKEHWPSAISFNLWIYNLQLANYIRNSTPGKKDIISPEENFSQICIQPKIKAFHSFFYPVYAINNMLQVGKYLNKY